MAFKYESYCEFTPHPALPVPIQARFVPYIKTAGGIIVASAYTDYIIASHDWPQEIYVKHTEDVAITDFTATTWKIYVQDGTGQWVETINVTGTEVPTDAVIAFNGFQIGIS